MTTIAWDGKTLAADTLCTTDEGAPIYGQKIWRTSSGLFGAAGDDPIIEAVLIWLQRGAQPRHKPELAKDSDFTGLLIEPDGTPIVMDHQLMSVRYDKQPHAIGTGGAAARAFMQIGMTAPGAVQKVIDLKLDINTGGEVRQLGLEPHPRRNRKEPSKSSF